jgi:hypothetical protein
VRIKELEDLARQYLQGDLLINDYMNAAMIS